MRLLKALVTDQFPAMARSSGPQLHFIDFSSARTDTLYWMQKIHFSLSTTSVPKPRLGLVLFILLISVLINEGL